MIETNMTPRPEPGGLRRGTPACAWAFAAAMTFLAPTSVPAQEEAAENDARLDGYENNVVIADDSVALTWILFVFLTMVTLGAVFKNAKRTHLD